MTHLSHLVSKPLRAAMIGALALAAPVALVAPTAPAAAQNNSGQLDRAVRALRAITTMKADFTQTDRNGAVVGGEVTLKNPGRIRFEYGNDVNMLVVSNGSALSVVDYDVRQVERYPISDSPLGALLDPNRNVAQYGRVMPSENPNIVSIAVRDSKRPEFPEIVLIFVKKASAPGGLELASWVANDSQNNRTTVRLRNHRYGMSVANSTFNYRDPRRSTRRPG